VEQPLRLQPLTRHRLAAMGEQGRAWVAALPELLAQLEQQWSISLGRAIPGGSGSYVAMATNANGSPAVVKVAVAEDGWADQVATLDRAQGRGYVRLLRADPSRRAMLLSRSAGRWIAPAGHRIGSSAALQTPSRWPGRTRGTCGRTLRPDMCSLTRTGSSPTAPMTSGSYCGTGAALLLGRDARHTAERLCAVLAERSGVDAQRIWE
jgi:hypothetical protein